MSRHVDALVNPATRGRALEVALVGHVLLNPQLLDGRTVPRLSPAGRVLLALVDEAPACARLDILAHVSIQLGFARHLHCTRGSQRYEEPVWIHLVQCTRRARYRDVMRMAQSVSRLTISDLTFVPVEALLPWLDSHPPRRRSKVDRLLEQMEATAA
jgi:hypothetical protein